MPADTRSATGAATLFPPLDRRLGIPDRGGSSRLTRKVCEANLAGSFPKASRLLGSLAGLDLSAKQVQLLTERVGAILERERDGATADFLALRPASGPPPEPVSLLVITTDGGRVQTLQEDPDQKWKEDKIGVVYDALAVPETPGVKYAGPSPLRRSVVATMGPWEQLGDHLSALADRRGSRQAEQKVFVSDGAAAIRSVRERCFPDAAFVLDWSHATSHLHQMAQAAFGTGPPAEAWLDRQKDRLWNSRLELFFKELTRLGAARGPAPPKARPEDPRRILATNLEYFRTNREGLSYASFRRRGWPLASGIVESTVKQVGQRVKGSEKHWGMPGVETTLQIVTHLISTDGAWDRFWNRHPLSKTA